MTIPTRRIIVASRTRCMPLSHGAVTGRVMTGQCHDKSMMDDATGSVRRINPNQSKSTIRLVASHTFAGVWRENGIPQINSRQEASGPISRTARFQRSCWEIFSQRPRNVTNSRPRRGRIPPNHEFCRVLPRFRGRSAPGTAHRRKLPYRIRTSSSDTPQLAGLPPHRRYRNLWRKTAPDSIRHRRRHMDEENTKAPGFGGFRMLKLRLT